MKELSIKEKAKTYDKALEKAKALYKAAEPMSGCNVLLETLFPELKVKENEDEDEKIRGEIVAFLKETIEHVGISPDAWTMDNAKKWLAWLEEQNSYYTFEIEKGHWYKCVCDYMLNGSDLMFKNGRLYYCRSDWRLGGEIDERNVKNIGVHGYKSFFRPATNQEIKNWLEKQGEMKPAKNIVETWKDMRSEVYRQASGNRDVSNYSATKMFSLNDIDEIIKKMSEQKPTDEPKFKVDDWCIDNTDGTIFQIVKVLDNTYTYKTNDGKEYSCTHYSLENDARIWTIQDAKPGDVLATLDYILVFKEFLKNDGGISYCHYDFGSGNPQFVWLEDKNWYFGKKAIIHPATKEQRDTLLKEMADAGYTFDFDKKKLKKIEQAPAWSKEDEEKLNRVISLIHTLQEHFEIDNELKTWLKSIKDKCNWRPSDEQMEVLNDAIAHCSERYCGTAHRLVDLMQDLKKLKGE